MDRDEILRWLVETDGRRLAGLWRLADACRRRNVGEQVHLRGLIEFSNHCRRQCGYCGLRVGNTGLERYRMTAEEIVRCARQASGYGYGTVVLQSGEDPRTTGPWMAEVVARIKAETGLAVTLSLGERDARDYRLWRQAGADRYLLRFETSNRELFGRVHPPLRGTTAHLSPEACGTAAPGCECGTAAPGCECGTAAPGCDSPAGGGRNRPGPGPGDGLQSRLDALATLRRLGYEVGSGIMIGLPGQTYGDLATDIEMFARLDLDMIGVGPYLPHPLTPLGQGSIWRRGLPRAAAKGGASPAAKCRIGLNRRAIGAALATSPADQVPNTELMTYKVVALARLVCPRANIPATTALATVNLARGRELGLIRGANVIMPNLTPVQYRDKYEIYPAKACIRESADQCHGCIGQRIAAIGRQVGQGRGDARVSRAIAKQDC